MKKLLSMVWVCIMSLTALYANASSIVTGEDGYRLWLKYDPIQNQGILPEYKKWLVNWHVEGNSKTSQIIRDELDYAFNGLLQASNPTVLNSANLVVATAKTASQFLPEVNQQLSQLGDEGYVIRQMRYNNKPVVLVAANTDIGALYGTFALLRLVQTESDLSHINVATAPKTKVRVLNHWDNPDRHVERGFAGESIWDWHKLPDYKYQKYTDYARANASIGINGTVLNNVNADPIMLTPAYLEKVKALADLFRPYGLKVYLSIKFNSPATLGGLKNSDPLNPDVQVWWDKKVAEIYQLIPDFGGFLVKANSEGQPGPGDYGRTHAQGANMLADALKPHGGIVMWRAFVYANEKNEERSKQAYSEFKPLDGKFRENVMVQVKNGPIDFQPREPISPLFGATKQTPMMMEFQITMEYLGFSTHFVYLGPMYEEVLKTDTYAKGKGSTVGKVVAGEVYDYPITGMAGVSNIGSDRNWTGHIILQSNWYVFGRMAWDYNISAEQVAEEWTRMTLSNKPAVVKKVTEMMMLSHEATVNYMTPLGLHHIMGTGHHYGPGPWVDDLGRADWNPVYYHRAAKDGIGFDRSPSGVNAVEQYFSPLKEQLADPKTTPEKYLLWFHHLPWDYKVESSGRTLWNEIVHRYYLGVEQVAQINQSWDSLKGQIDPLQFKQVQMANTIHLKEAIWWRNACVLYFQTFSNQPIPEGLEKPKGTLEAYKAMQFPFAPGQGE
ncbi:alpha-glucuronidase [Catenovulum sp. 2E275]|uniref:alpha-glucuronidase family glycosyl hydrolase n=1 Tax=Catenovulum sp. 2E275 TaxID=2980497 RepID=UPI0021D2855C|nr:alpha-glucuronidase family glycosyl hydrolase [Catenovulum sp. 2E275]MCU4674039.1 alpha-glucuronidase [Catenovulum sp. 2E275]